MRHSLGEPDPFQFKHRAALRQEVADVVCHRLDRKAAVAFLARWTEENIVPDERERFREVAENDLLGLHEGNFARYQSPLPDQASPILRRGRMYGRKAGALGAESIHSGYERRWITIGFMRGFDCSTCFSVIDDDCYIFLFRRKFLGAKNGALLCAPDTMNRARPLN